MVDNVFKQRERKCHFLGYHRKVINMFCIYFKPEALPSQEGSGQHSSRCVNTAESKRKTRGKAQQLGKSRLKGMRKTTGPSNK